MPDNNSINQEVELPRTNSKDLFESNKDLKATDKFKTEVNVVGTQPKIVKLNFKTIPAAQAQNNNATNNNIECTIIIIKINF